VCSAEDGETLVKTAISKFGGVHVLVANAGILRDKSFTAMTEKEWDDVLAVHLRYILGMTLRPSAYSLSQGVHTRVPRQSGQFSNSKSMVVF